MHFFLLNIIHKQKTVFSEKIESKISMFEIENLLLLSFFLNLDLFNLISNHSI